MKRIPTVLNHQLLADDCDLILQHPVAGATGKWFAEKTIIGKQISQKIGNYPDPTQHWAVIVGDYVHQLWMV